MRWVEGIHYSKAEDGSLKCERCQKTISSLPGLGPHLSACFRQEGKGTTLAPSEEAEVEPLPTEEEALESMLKEMGVKRAKPIARMLAYSGWDSYADLHDFLKLSGVSPDRVILCLEAWSRHRGTSIPISLVQSLQTERQSLFQQAGSQALTVEELNKILDERERKRREQDRISMLEQEVLRLKSGEMANPGKSEVQVLREELAKMRQDEVLKRLERIEGQISGPILNAYGLCAEGIRAIKDLSQNSALKWYLVSGSPYPPMSKEVSEEAKQGIFQRLDKRYISEE